jgi:hypothetical protein
LKECEVLLRKLDFYIENYIQNNLCDEHYEQMLRLGQMYAGSTETDDSSFFDVCDLPNEEIDWKTELEKIVAVVKAEKDDWYKRGLTLSQVDIAPLLSDVITRLVNGDSISELFD